MSHEKRAPACLGYMGIWGDTTHLYRGSLLNNQDSMKCHTGFDHYPVSKCWFSKGIPLKKP